MMKQMTFRMNGGAWAALYSRQELFLCLLYCLASCAMVVLLTVPAVEARTPEPSSVQRTCHLEGTITDAFTGKPIRGAVVTLEPGSLSVFTFSDGHYSFTDLAPGACQIAATAAGYMRFTSPVLLQQDYTTLLDIALRLMESRSGIKGVVVDGSTMRGVVGADISVEPGGLVERTDAAGFYAIQGLEPGAYTLSVTHEGYFPLTRTVEVAAGESREENFVLFRQTGRIMGLVQDAATHQPINRATVRSDDRQLSTSTSAAGIYLLRDIFPGNYSLIFEAPNYQSVRRTGIQVAVSSLVVLNIDLQPTGPRVRDARAEPQDISIPLVPVSVDDPAASVLLKAQVEDPDGPQDIRSVIVDLSPLDGPQRQSMYDDGTHGDERAGDGIYSVRIAAAPDTPVGEAALTVTAIDSHGARDQADISVHAFFRRDQRVSSSQVDAYVFRNRIPGQVLVLQYQILPTGTRSLDAAQKVDSAMGSLEEACTTTIQIEDPNGNVVGTYPLTATTFETQIPNAAAGQWTYRVSTQCPDPQSYSSSARGSGTGLIVGVVRDSVKLTGIDGALIQSDLGSTSLSTDGRFLMIAPAGVANLLATAFGYARTTAQGIALLSGQTREVDMSMIPLLSLRTSESTYVAGSALGFTVQYFNPDNPQQVDTYFFILLPDGRTFIALDEQLIPHVHTLGDNASLEPVGRNLPFATTTFRMDNFYAFTGVEPAGEYALYMILTRPGSRPENPADWVAWAESKFVYR